jgi:hypothetical protein
MYLSDNLDVGYLCEWLYAQPCWDSSPGSLAMLSLLAKLEETNEGPDYYFHGGVAPKQYLQSGIPGLVNVSDEFSLPEGTIIWGIGAYSDQPQGLKLQVFERGSQQNLFGRTYGKDGVVTGQNDNSLTTPNGIAILPDPIFVIPPGQIQIQIANLAQDTAMIQVFFACAVPLVKGITGVYSQKVAA